MTLRLLLSALIAASLASCACRKPKAPYIITDYIPACSRVEYYAQIHDGSWKQVMVMNTLPRPMHVKVAEKWALSAAQQKLGGHWKDYCFRVTPPEGEPIIFWQRQGQIQL